jgi:hypothetical protein
MSKKEKVTTVKAIKTFFEADGGRKVTTKEFMALDKPDRMELALLCAAELGVEIG